MNEPDDDDLDDDLDEGPYPTDPDERAAWAAAAAPLRYFTDGKWPATDADVATLATIGDHVEELYRVVVRGLGRQVTREIYAELARQHPDDARLAELVGQLSPIAPPSRMAPIGFPVARFEPNGQREIQVGIQPQRSFRPRRLVASLAGGGARVVITEIRIGGEPSLLSGDPIPVEVFAPTMPGSDLAMPLVHVGQWLYVTLRLADDAQLIEPTTVQLVTFGEVVS